MKVIFDNIYTENKISHTGCELIDREDFWWWASENTTGTERNIIVLKIQCHINELIILMKEICHYQGTMQEGFKSVGIEETKEEIIMGRHRKTCECGKCMAKKAQQLST